MKRKEKLYRAKRIHKNELAAELAKLRRDFKYLNTKLNEAQSEIVIQKSVLETQKMSSQTESRLMQQIIELEKQKKELLRHAQAIADIHNRVQV